MLGAEVLDDPRADPAAVRRTLRDIVRLNRLFGGTGTVLWGLRRIFERGMRNAERGTAERWSLLDALFCRNPRTVSIASFDATSPAL